MAKASFAGWAWLVPQGSVEITAVLVRPVLLIILNSMKKYSWFKRRNYAHFDWPCTDADQLNIILSSPEKVASRAFFPFLKYYVVTKKYDKTKKDVKIKKRPIMFACHTDSHLYSYYNELLSKRYEDILRDSSFSESILAFRKLGKCNIHFAKQAFNTIRNLGECCVLAFDISKFFDKIDHRVLKNEWATVLNSKALPDDHYNVYKSLTKYACVDKDALFKRFGFSKHGRKPIRLCSIKDFRNIVRGENLIKVNCDRFGIPQGSPISGVLSNISLLSFDQNVSQEVKNKKAFYFRYCDDILIICSITDCSSFERLINDELKKVHLATNEKTKKHFFTRQNNIVKSNTPLQYLGFMYDGQRIFIRSSSVSRFQYKMKRRIILAKKSQNKNNKKRVLEGKAGCNLYKRKLLSRNTHFGKRNFIRYGLRSAAIMESSTIKRQIARMGNKFSHMLDVACKGQPNL